MAFTSWPLIINEFPPTFVDKITAIITRYNKSWLKLHKSASPELLFLPCPGLNIKHPTTCLKTLQVSKHIILSKSSDSRTRYIAAKNLAKATAARDKRWKPELEAVKLEKEILWEEKYYKGKHIVSSAKRNTTSFSNSSPRSQRRSITQRLKHYDVEERRNRLRALCRGGNVLTWDSIMEHDVSWKELMYDIPEQVLSFRLNGTAMTLPSLSNLRRWGIKRWGTCPLCGKPNVTMAHVLSKCIVALRHKRYIWRHDNVLATIANDLYGMANRSNRQNTTKRPPTKPSFVTAGTNHKTKSKNTSLLTRIPCTDWQVNIDFDSSLTIPVSTGVDTILRPDVVLYSDHDKQIIWGELTVPLERNILDAHIRKKCPLCRAESKLKNGWLDSSCFYLGDR